MNTKLLLFLSFISSTIFAQFPNDYVARYNFTNGDLENVVNPGNGDLTTSSTTSFSSVGDRFGKSNQAMQSNPTAVYSGYTFSSTNNLTLSFYFRGGTSSITRRIAQFYDSSGQGFRIDLNPGGGMAIVFNNNNATTSLISDSGFANSIHNGQWHLITLTIEKTTSGYNIRTYRNAVNVGFLSTTINDTTDFITSNAPFVINPTSNFGNQLDDIIIYNRALTQAEVSSLYTRLQTEIVYVDANATGSNNGSNWANAYTNPQIEFRTFHNHNVEYWIAGGTYIPNPNASVPSFVIERFNVKVYGGFAGTENFLSERDESQIHTTNKAIFSGDVSMNDNGTDANYTDNLKKVVIAEADELLLDGITISGGHFGFSNNGDDRFGAGIFVPGNGGTPNLELNNCILENNTALWGAALAFTPNNAGSPVNITINRCIFRNNTATVASSFYMLPNTGETLTATITNSLFSRNSTKNITAGSGTASVTQGAGASAGWFRAFYSGSSINLTYTNNTIALNENEGSSASDFPSVGLSVNQGTFTNLTNANNIFWVNRSNNGSVSLAFGRASGTGFVNLPVQNSVDENNFSNITNKQNTTNANPRLNNDFEITSGSSAIDAGNNTFANGNLDLAGNSRIINSTIDIGAFEYDSSLSTDDFITDSSITIYPNPTQNFVHISSNQLNVKKVELYNLLGKKVLESINKKIDVSSLSKGIYLIQISLDNKTVTHKLIRN